MMIKVALLMLLALAVLGIFGGLRMKRRRPGAGAAARCTACGRPRLGKTPCACGKV